MVRDSNVKYKNNINRQKYNGEHQSEVKKQKTNNN